MTTLSFDIFARNHSSKEFDRLSNDLKKSVKDFDNFGNRAALSFAKTANSLSNIPTAAAALSGVGQIVSGLSGLLGLLPAAAAAAGAGFATLAVGVSGFTDGLKELADSSKISKAAAGAADGAVQAARRIETANQSLVRAQRGVKDAEETLARAQMSAKQAQDDLRRARERAAEQLDDLKRAVSGAALDEEAAVLAVERAQQQLAEAQRNGASGLDLREAELGIRQAEQALADTRDRYADLKKEAETANKAGVDGSDEVLSAQQQIADSARAVEHAQQGVADAAENVRDAQREVAQAHEDAARGAAKSAAALGVTTEAFDKLSKNAQDTVRAVLGLGDAWTGLKHSVQDSLFAGVADQVKSLGGTYIPVLKTGMTGIAQEFNKGAHSLADFLKEGEQVKTIQTIFAGSKDVTGQFTQALKPLVSILLDVAAVGSEMLPGLTGGFTTAAESAAAFVRNARETGALREWIQQGLDTLKKLGEVFGNIATIIGTVFSGLNAGGKSFLDTMVEVTGKVKDFLRSFEGQEALKALGQALGAVSKAVTEVLLVALRELSGIIVKLAPGFAELARQVGSVLVDALEILGPILSGIAGFLSDNIDWIGPLVIALGGLAVAIDVVTVATKALTAAAAINPWVIIIAALIVLVTLIVTHWDDIKEALRKAWDWIETHARDAWDHIKSAIVDPIVSAAEWIGRLVGNIIGFFRGIPEGIGKALGAIGGVFRDAFKGAVNIAIDAINWMIRRVNDLTYGINLINPFADIPPIHEIPKMHTGGVVPGAPGMESLFMLEAGETVLPANWQPAAAPTIPPPRIPSTSPQMAASGGGGEMTLRVTGSGGLFEAFANGLRVGDVQLVDGDGRRVRVA